MAHYRVVLTVFGNGFQGDDGYAIDVPVNLLLDICWHRCGSGASSVLNSMQAGPGQAGQATYESLDSLRIKYVLLIADDMFPVVV